MAKKEIEKSEEKKEEVKVEETKKEEEKVEPKEEPKKEEAVKTEEKTEAKVEETKVEEKVEAEKSDKGESKEVTVKVDASAIESIMKKFAEDVKAVSDSISKASEKIVDSVNDLKKSAPAEKAAVVEKPKEEVKETPKEEVKKADTSSEGASEKVLKELADIKKMFEDRISELEKQPAPSKVVLYQKDFAGGGKPEELTLEKINDRLKELDTMRKQESSKYMNEGYVDEAFELIRKKKTLTASK